MECAIETNGDTEKLDKIRDIVNSGNKVKHFILRHGLSEPVSFEVEAAVIDFIGMENLSNLQSGHYSSDFSMLKLSIEQYIEEIEEHQVNTPEHPENKLENPISKVFISHASKDVEVVEKMIEILESIGLDSNQIFCTSFEGYGIELGENFLDSIKGELSSDCLVIFILSKSFYESAVCLCEMGAAWVLVKEHILVLIPPLDFSDVKRGYSAITRV
ncbi:MAG: hypothetical protein A6F72_04770 [Cycloclasticus sp. symbiont of Poecilosclerida sp. N]|nr:MAG: hypothetical protein A6F72_04770 [Cycloclasticus sp. symbiont of Poecilosclerida sp. N]